MLNSYEIDRLASNLEDRARDEDDLKSAKMLRVDLEAAWIPYRDEQGRFLDFHSLRHSFVSRLARSGIMPAVAKDLARHSTITLTMDRYTHGVVGNGAAALNALPDLSAPACETARRTGTDGAAAGASSLAPPLRQTADFGATSANHGELKDDVGRVARGPETPEKARETSKNVQPMEAAVGFEPTKYGGFANRCLDPLGYAALANPRDAHVHMPAGVEAPGF